MSYQVLQTIVSGADGCPASALVRLARSCSTSFGAPVVPEVSRIHSVACERRRVTSPGSSFGSLVMQGSMPSPVELDHCERRGELVLYCQQHRAAAQLLESAAKARCVGEVSESDCRVNAAQAAGADPRGGDGFPQRTRLTGQSFRTA